MPDHAQTVRDYLRLLSDLSSPPEALAAFFHPEVQQVEYPNRLVPNGATRSLEQLLDGFARGKQVTRAQSFAPTRIIVDGDVVAAEFDWWAELTVPVGTLPTGGRMTGHFATVIEFRDSLIWRQRNYDCFEPF